jgi:hypothetical protein
MQPKTVPIQPTHSNNSFGIPAPEPLSVALRAYVPQKKRGRSARFKTMSSEWALIFDCETMIESSQRLRFGVYQVRKGAELYEDEHGPEHGIFYAADDPEAISVHDLAELKKFAAKHRLKLMSLQEFIEDVLFGIAYDFRATIVGFNLPFDISRLAINHSSAHATTYTPKANADGSENEKVTNRAMMGAFTLEFPTTYPLGVRIKHLSSKDALIQFVGRPGKFKYDYKDRIKGWRSKRRGFFIDVKTLAAALMGLEGDLRLETVANELKTEHRKLGTEDHGKPLNARYIEYAVMDVQVTWECYCALLDRYKSHELTETPAHLIHSEASVGKSYLREMNVKPWNQVQPDFPHEIVGNVMSAYFGGRSEVRLRRVITRVLYCDFLSMYPTVSTLMGLWWWVIAQGVDCRDDTAAVRELLERVSLDDLQKPEFWPLLTVMVQVKPCADIFPVRADYDGSGSFRLAVNVTTSDKPLWFTLADCIASKLLNGDKAPEIVRAIRFTPRAAQQGLKPIKIMGKEEYLVDPYSHDFYARLIDLRSEIRKGQEGAAPDVAARIELEQLALKKVANATSYGIFIELNVETLRSKEKATRHGFEGCPVEIEIKKSEKEGEYFHPLVGAFTTSAARLMLGITERRIQDEGLDWALCDTDSMAIAKPAAMSEGEFLERATRVREWFNPLNPYSDKGPLLREETDNYALKEGREGTDGNTTKAIEPLYAYAISAKRYGLFNLNKDGKPVIRKALAHGLGHLLRPVENPKPVAGIPEPATKLSKIGVNRWQYDFWYRILEAALAGTPDEAKCDDLPGFKRPAASRYGATTPRMLLLWFKRHNAGLPYPRRVRPFNFLLAFQPRRANPILAVDNKALGSKRAVQKALQDLPRPIAPFDKNPLNAARQAFDRISGRPIPITDLKTYAEVLADYHIHPEAKFANGDYFDRGPTRRRHVFIIGEQVQHIGKESDRLEERVYLFESDDVIDYGKGQFAACDNLTALRQARRELTVTAIARASVLSRKEVTRILAEAVKPTRRTWAALAKGIAVLRREL